MAAPAAPATYYTRFTNYVSAQYDQVKKASYKDLTSAECLKSVKDESLLAKVAKVAGRILAAVATVALAVLPIAWAGVKLIPSSPAYVKSLFACSAAAK